MSRGKRAISVRAIEVLLYIAAIELPIAAFINLAGHQYELLVVNFSMTLQSENFQIFSNK